MFKKFQLFLAAFLICGFLFPIPVHAQDEKPAWWYNLDCDPKEQKYSGIQYCTGKSPNENIHVIVIQLDSPGVRVEYLLPDGIDKFGVTEECKDVNRSTKYLGGPGCDDPENRNWYPVMSLEQVVNKALKQPNLAVVINGDYSACTTGPNSCRLDKDGNPTYREHGPEGYTVVRGTRLDGPKNGDGDKNIVRRPYLVVGQSVPLRAEFHQSNSDDGSIQYSWAYTGMGGAPWLIQNGEVSTKAITSCENAAGSCYDGASQTAVGLTSDKKWMFLVLAVKAKTLLDVATFMDNKLDVWQAIKFDGGGSSQLYYEGAKKSYVETGDSRLLTNFLAVYAQPGSGIFPETSSDTPTPSDPPDAPSDDDDLNWWQKVQKDWTDFWRNADNWWKEKKQDASDWWSGIKTWWQELPQRVEDWLFQQFMNWLNQKLNKLCGSTGLIPVTIITLIYARNRRFLKSGV